MSFRSLDSHRPSKDDDGLASTKEVSNASEGALIVKKTEDAKDQQSSFPQRATTFDTGPPTKKLLGSDKFYEERPRVFESTKVEFSSDNNEEEEGHTVNSLLKLKTKTYLDLFRHEDIRRPLCALLFR